MAEHTEHQFVVHGCTDTHSQCVHCWKHQQWAHELDHGAIGKGGVVWIIFSFTSCGCPGPCVLLTWVSSGTRIHYGKKAARWRQGNVLLVPSSMWMLRWHLAKYCCRPYTWKQYSKMTVASFSRIAHTATKQMWFRSGLRSLNLNEFEGNVANILVLDTTALVESMPPPWVNPALAVQWSLVITQFTSPGLAVSLIF